MTLLNVQFSDSTEKTVVSYFASPQDATVWSNLGQVDSSDARWAAFYNAACPFVQKRLPAPNS